MAEADKLVMVAAGCKIALMVVPFELEPFELVVYIVIARIVSFVPVVRVGFLVLFLEFVHFLFPGKSFS